MKDLFRMLPQIMEKSGNSVEFQQAIVFGAWRKAAGESLANHTFPKRLRGKKLTICVADGTWKRHLESLAGQMIFSINSIIGNAAITFIEFQIDEKRFEREMGISTAIKPSTAESQDVAMDELSAQLRKSARAITDGDLRDQFLRAAAGCLARKKRMAGIR
ncbi:MAG: DUF721 domain-containing protein [Acidobacteria bacterium]|nr:DUF721 domain-containing protein [Acidobacteriota bacterium]